MVIEANSNTYVIIRCKQSTINVFGIYYNLIRDHDTSRVAVPDILVDEFVGSDDATRTRFVTVFYIT